MGCSPSHIEERNVTMPEPESVLAAPEGKTQDGAPIARNGWSDENGWNSDTKSRKYLTDLTEDCDKQKKLGLAGIVNCRYSEIYYPQGGKEVKLESKKGLNFLIEHLKARAKKEGLDWQLVVNLVFDKQYWQNKEWKKDPKFLANLKKIATYNGEKHHEAYVSPRVSENRAGNICLMGIIDGVFEPDWLSCGIPVVMMRKDADIKEKFLDLRIGSYVAQCLLLARLGGPAPMFDMFGGGIHQKLLNVVFLADILGKNHYPPSYQGILRDDIDLDTRICGIAYDYFEAMSLINANASVCVDHHIQWLKVMPRNKAFQGHGNHGYNAAIHYARTKLGMGNSDARAWANAQPKNRTYDNS